MEGFKVKTYIKVRCHPMDIVPEFKVYFHGKYLFSKSDPNEVKSSIQGYISKCKDFAEKKKMIEKFNI